MRDPIDLFPLAGEGAPDPSLPRLPAFLAVYGPAQGYAVETTFTDLFGLKPGLLHLYVIVLQAGRTPEDAGLPALALADPTLVCRATLRDDRGRVLATATAARAILADQDVEILETAARRRLAAALGFGEEVLPPIPGAPEVDPIGVGKPGGAVGPAERSPRAASPGETAPLAASPSTEAARQTLPPPAAASDPDAGGPAALPAADAAPPGREPVPSQAVAPAALAAVSAAPPPDDAAALALLRRQLAHLAKTRGVEPPAVATKAEAHAAIKALLRP